MSIKSFLPFALVYLLGVLLSSFAQIILKKEAVKEHASFLAQYLNPSVIIGYGIIFGCTLLTLLAYRGGLPMSWGNVLESGGYVFVTLLGVTILKEKVSKEKLAALVVIMVGIVLFALG